MQVANGWRRTHAHGSGSHHGAQQHQLAPLPAYSLPVQTLCMHALSTQVLQLQAARLSASGRESS